MTKLDIIKAIANELDAACMAHNKLNSVHEAYAVIMEEIEEFWLEVMKKKENRNKRNMRKELIQIAAMAARAVYDLLPEEPGVNDG